MDTHFTRPTFPPLAEPAPEAQPKRPIDPVIVAVLAGMIGFGLAFWAAVAAILGWRFL